MRELAYRLHKGDDLKQFIEACGKDFDTAIVLSSVGSISSLSIRLAGAKDYINKKEDLEIISLNGTISKSKAHLHISASDSRGNVYGGHLCDGTIINTTCELVLGILENYTSIREHDENTGYSEIAFREVRND